MPAGRRAEPDYAQPVDHWPAPVARGPVNGSVTVPGSKSLTNRALILAALATGPSRIYKPLAARDTQLMRAALGVLGARITKDPTGDWVVEPGPFDRSGRIDCGLAGTVMRFVPAIAGLADGDIVFDGDPQARVRPMSTMITALRDAGIIVEDGDRGTLPFTVRGRGSVSGGAIEVDASASSQFISAVLLAGARYERGIQVRHVGRQSVPSGPHITMTVRMLQERGVDVSVGPESWSVAPGAIRPLDITIEPDLSNAAPYLAAALVTGGGVCISGWPDQTTQPGAQLTELFAQMGATTSRQVDTGLTGTSALTLTGPDRLEGLIADLHEVGELTPVIAACCALANSPSRLTGIGHLRGHETDRLAALATEINALGGKVEVLADGLAIEPAPLHGGIFHTYDDHRLATAAAVIGLCVEGVLVENIDTTSKTLPDFATTWSRLVDAERDNRHA